jgi:transposase
VPGSRPQIPPPDGTLTADRGRGHFGLRVGPRRWPPAAAPGEAHNSLLGVVSCDSAYQGLARRAARLRLQIDVIKNPSRHQFVAVYPRWIVERSFAWLSAHRRLGQRDLEHTIQSAETWVKVAAIAFMLDRLAPKPDSPQSRRQMH